MTRLFRQPWGPLRGVALMLAVLALVVKVSVPAGFMTASEPRNGLPFALVLCTGAGPLVVEPGGELDHSPRDKGPVDKSAHDMPCPFAGHGLAMGPPNDLVSTKVEFVAYVQPAATPLTYLTPGRGLAAPPLPARGPPSLLI